MDFFQAQDNALRNTKRLVFFYAVAVFLIVVAVYLAVTVGVFTYVGLTRPENASYAPIDRVDLIDASRLIWTLLGVVGVVGLGSLYKTLSLRSGGSAVATSLGGERVDRSTRDHKRRQLLNVVEEMAIASGVPVPEVYILNQEASINAFAAGWGRDDAVIAVSAGALETLSRDELQGVVAHEYSHVLHGDCRLNIRLMGVLFGIMMLSVFGRLMSGIFRGGGFIYVGGGRRRSSGGGGSRGGKGNGGALIIAVIVVIILVTIIGYIGAFFGRLIQAAISRQREYLADAAAVQFTRNPDGIAGALKKIGGHVEHGVLHHPAAAEAAHMFFADGLKRGFSSALATHPPLDERIRQIQPGWDGKYERSEPAPRTAPKTETKATASEDGASAGRRMIEGMAVLGAIGTMSRENLATARQITSRIPASIDEATRDMADARKTITALVMADNTLDDEAQLKLVQSALEQEDAARVQELYDLVKDLPRDSRLAVLELATTTLAQASAPGREDFLSLLNNLIQVDEKLSLYEFCIRRILRERLTRGDREPSAETRVQYLQLKPVVANAVGHLLSVVAREASGTDKPEKLLEQALQPLYLLKGKVAYQSAEASPVGKLDHSLNILRTSAFAIRAQCLRAAVHCIQADGKLSPKEAELLRMLSLSLDCPAPPLGN